jgi:hypothetical protein
LVTGIASSLSNALFAWLLFHAFMVVLLTAELLMSWLSSDHEGFLRVAHQSWLAAADEDISEVQHSFRCCGFVNVTDKPPESICPESFDHSCQVVLTNILNTLSQTGSVAIFIDFVFAMFIDFAGCGICFHPDVVTLQQIQEETDIAELLTSNGDLSLPSLALDPMLGEKVDRD